ncbi:hypothetical protein D1831_14225, partial [Lactiplantibacillus garii]
MKIEDFDNMYEALEKRGNRGNLMTLNAPTGSGKTFTITRFLVGKAINDPKFRGFFISDQKKNLNISSFKAEWKNRSKKPFYQHVAIMRSLTDTVALIIEDFNKRDDGKIKGIPRKLFENEQVQERLNLLSDQYYFTKKMMKKENDITTYSALKKSEYVFRQKVIEYLCLKVGVKDSSANESRVKIRNYVRSNVDEVSQWVSKIYPSIDLDHRQICIMTTMKFKKSFPKFFSQGSQEFLQADVLNDALVILDEFDSTKNQFLSDAIERALMMKTDFLGLFNAIRNGLIELPQNKPTELSEIILNKTNYTQLLKRANQMCQRYKLDYLYKSDESNTSDNYIFHLPYYLLISGNENWETHLNSEKKRVDINHSQEKNNLHFSEMLAQVTIFLEKFAKVFFSAARQYADSVNKLRVSTENQMTIHDASYSIYNALGLTNDQIDVLVAVWEDLGFRQIPQQSKFFGTNTRPAGYQQFQKRGLQIFALADSDRHAMRTNINGAFLQQTPERFLLDVIKKANVLGLSATADIKTVLDNYDMDYLKDQLQGHFFQGKQCLTDATKAQFNIAKKYDEMGIQVSAFCAYEKNYSMKNQMTDVIAQRLTSSELEIIDGADLDKLNHIFNKGVSRLDDNYFVQRYLELFDSFVIFLRQPTATSFLGLQGPLPNDNTDYKMNAGFIQQIFDQLRTILC